LPLQTWVLERANWIISTSETYASHSPWLSAYLGKIRYVPSCIKDRDSVDFKIKNIDKISALKLKYRNKNIVFALGRLTYYKGFSILIRAAASLPEDSIVIIGGDGDLCDALKEEARQNMVQDKVIFAGCISAEDLPFYYSAAHVFCLPSILRSEAFGLVMVEAMSYGCPIVATDIPGSGGPWVNQNGVTGINVKPGDPKELSNALTQLLGDVGYARKLGEAGRRRFEANFELSRMIDNIESIYNEIWVTEN
jgi:glycosyltransferase involved in cell wall biosynthesis